MILVNEINIMCNSRKWNNLFDILAHALCPVYMDMFG